MAEKVEILNLDINTDKVESDILELKKRITELKEEQKKAKESSGELSKEYIQASASLKVANNQLSSTEKLYVQLTEAQDDNIGTIKKLTAENAKLRKEQEALDLTTEAGIKRNEELNAQINKNTETIKGNVDQRKQELMNVGNYPGAFGKMGSAINETVPAFGRLGAAAKAFIANPIGLVLTAIVVVVGLLVKAFQRSEESMNKVRKITGAISGLFSGLLNILKPLANFIADKLILAFEGLALIADKAMGLISKGLKALGFNEASQAVDKFNQSMKESAKVGQELADMEAKYAKAKRETEKVMLNYQRREEKLRQLRDDESRGIPARIKANEELGKVLREQLKAELDIANQALAIAEKRIQLEGDTTENLDARAEALTTIADINERITGQESEQLANLNSLRKEAADAEKARIEELAKKKKEASDKQAEEARKAAEENIKYLDFELEKWKLNNKEKLSSTEELNKELIQAEENRLNEQFAKEQEILQFQLDTKMIDQIDYQKSIIQLEEEKNTRISELNEQFRIQEQEKEKERLISDYENKKALLDEHLLSMFEIQKLDLERQRNEELKIAEKIGASKVLINKKYDKAERAIERAKTDAKIEIAAGFTSNIAKIFGEQTKIGKAAAVAETTINTYKAATGAYSALAKIPYVGPFLGIAAAAAAVASGLANVKNILSVNENLTSGSSAPPSPSATSGITAAGSSSAITVNPVSVNSEIGQGIVSRSQIDNTEQIAKGVEQGMSNVKLQPTQVIDDVTSKQLQKGNNLKTQNL